MNTQSMIESIQGQLNIAQQELDGIVAFPCLQMHNTVVCFTGTGLTIDTDAEGRPVVSNKILATQFTPYAAARICENVTNGKGERPEPLTLKQYYSLQVKLLQETLEIFKSL